MGDPNATNSGPNPTDQVADPDQHQRAPATLPSTQPQPQPPTAPQPSALPPSALSPAPAAAAAAPQPQTSTPTPRPSSQPPNTQQAQAPEKPSAHGSPTRVYLNQSVTPHLLEAMKYLAAYEPEKPLKFLSEWLARRSAEVEGA